MGIMSIVSSISNFLWGWPILIFMIVAAVLLTIRTRAVQIVHFNYMLTSTLGLIGKKSPGEGMLHPFQAAMASISGTIGIGNIAGVGMAVGIGGMGAVFWMWVVALFSMITKYSEVCLGVKYREKDEKTGEYMSGPMYYITNGIGKNWKWLALTYAVLFSFCYCSYTSVQSNTIARAMSNFLNIKPLMTGIALAVLASLVVFGGLKGLARVADKLVPFMTILYFIFSLFIIVTHIGSLPSVLASIVGNAFKGSAPLGGFVGSTVILSMRQGFARGVFSNDGGLGLGAVMHGTAVTTHPAKEGMWGIFEVFLDTIIVCTCTALVICFTGSLDSGLKGLDLTTRAFDIGLGNARIGTIVVSISVLLFGYTTILCDIVLCELGMRYVFKNSNPKIVANVVRVICLCVVVYGSLGGLSETWDLADMFMAMLIFLNLPILIYKSKEVGEITLDYFGESKKYLDKKYN